MVSEALSGSTSLRCVSPSVKSVTGILVTFLCFPQEQLAEAYIEDRSSFITSTSFPQPQRLQRCQIFRKNGFDLQKDEAKLCQQRSAFARRCVTLCFCIPTLDADVFCENLDIINFLLQLDELDCRQSILWLTFPKPTLSIASSPTEAGISGSCKVAKGTC